MIDYKPTAEVINNAANELEYRAKELRRYAKELEEKKDFEYAVEAMRCFFGLFQNVRLDLFAVQVHLRRQGKAGGLRSVREADVEGLDDRSH